MRRSAKDKNGKSLTSSTEDPGSDLVESRKLVKRVTRHNGGGNVEDGKLLPEKVSVGKKGTAAALLGGKRAGTASCNETRLEMSRMITQSTRRSAVGSSSSSVQRKIPKAKRMSEETGADSKSEGASLKRRRMEDSVEAEQSEVEHTTGIQTVVRHSVVEEEEVVESSEVDICEDEPTPVDDEKNKCSEETQQLLKLVSFNSQSAQSTSTQKAPSDQGDEHLDAESGETFVQNREEETSQDKDLDVVVSASTMTTKEVTEEDKNKEVECRGKPKKISDCAARLSAKSEEYFSSMDAGSEVFSDGDDIENLLRIEQRCASVQSWVARHSHGEIEMEPNVEQMEVEEEVTVEGGGVLLVEAGTLRNSEAVSENSSEENKRSPQTVEITVAKSASSAVVADDLCSVDEEKSASDERINEEIDLSVSSLQTAVGSFTADNENKTIQNSKNDEVFCHQISEDIACLTEERSTSNLGVDSSSLEEPPAGKDLNDTEINGAAVESSPEENVPFVLNTDGNVISAVETSDRKTDEKWSTNGSSSDVNACHTEDQDTKEASVETVSCTASTETPGTETKKSLMPEVTQLDEQCSGAMKITTPDSQVSEQSESASTAVPQSDSNRPDPAAGDEDASFEVAGETEDNSAENLPGTSPSVDSDNSRENTEETDKSSSYKVQCNAVEEEDKLRSSETNLKTDASPEEVAEAEDGLKEESSEKVVMSSAGGIQPGPPVPVVASNTTSGAPAVSVVVARTFSSTVAGSGGPAATSVVAAGAVPGFVGMPPVAIRAAMPGSAVGSVFVHVADPRQFAMHLQQQQQGQVQGQAQTPVYIPTLSPQQGGGPPQLVMSPLSPQQVALLSSSMPATTQPPHQLMGGVPPRHVTLVTSGPRPQLLQQCLLTSAGPQPLALLSAPSTSNTTSGASSSTAPQTSMPVQHLAILSHALHGAGGTATSTSVPTSGHQQPVALIAAPAGLNQTPVMRMAPAMIPRHPMSASSAMQHLTSAVQQTISLQQLQLSFAAAAAAAQQQQQQHQLASSAVRPPIPIQRLPVLCTAQPFATSSTSSPCTSSSLAGVSVASAPAASLPVSPMVSVAASALTAFLKKENITSQLLPPPATTIAKLSPHDVALKGAY